MRIGSLNLETNLFLSPLAGYTNPPFRIVGREIGGVGLATTDIVNACSLLEERDKAFKLIETNLLRTVELVRGIVSAVKIPVAAKMRLGWDD